jgi:hypothetical protein
MAFPPGWRFPAYYRSGASVHAVHRNDADFEIFFTERLGGVKLFIGRIRLNFLNFHFVHKSCGQNVEKLGDESENVIKLYAFLRSAYFLSNKIYNNINMLN